MWDGRAKEWGSQHCGARSYSRCCWSSRWTGALEVGKLPVEKERKHQALRHPLHDPPMPLTHPPSGAVPFRCYCSAGVRQAADVGVL